MNSENPHVHSIESIQRMLRQAQTFSASGTPSEAITRAKKACEALQQGTWTTTPSEQATADRLLRSAQADIARYEAELATWTAEIEARHQVYTDREREAALAALDPSLPNNRTAER